MTTPSVAAPDTETDIVTVRELPGQHAALPAVVPLAVIAQTALVEAWRICRADRGLARRAPAAIASVHPVTSLK